MRTVTRFLAVCLVAVALLGLPQDAYRARAFGGCGPGVSKVDKVSDFYDAINAGPTSPLAFRQAYACYSAAFQRRTPYVAWLKGYATSLHSQFLANPRLLANGSVAFTLLATDALAGHRVFSQFAGTWTLAWQHGWRLDKAAIHLADRRDGPSLAFSDALLARLVSTSIKSSIELPVWLPFSNSNIAWEQGPIEGGITITLARGAPIADANTLFTETITQTYVPTAGVDGRVALANHSQAFYYAPFNHGGNGQPQLQWLASHQAYQITYACQSKCLPTLVRIANSLAPFYDSWG